MVSFNPRICKRCDIRFWYWWRLSLVSIHASVKDATCRPYYGYSYCHSFNPRICKRCDISIRLCEYKFGVSIHASVKDATPNNEYGYETLRFQSTHL